MKIYVPLDSIAVALGANEVAKSLTQQGFDVIRTGSRGLFWLEPMIEIDSDQGRIGFGPITLDDLIGVDEGNLEQKLQNRSLGLVQNLLSNQNRQSFARMGAIAPTDFEAFQLSQGMAGFQKALKMSGQEIIDEVKTSGLRGRGGAGFPTGIKWQTVHDAQADEKFIVCNADEGDSATFADRMIMEGDPFALIEGMAIAGLAVGAQKGFVYLRSEYPIAQNIFEEALTIARSQGLLGAYENGKSFDITLRMGAGAYVCGEETALLESLEGKRGVVRAKPPLPAIEGLFGQPTVVNNVLSFVAIPTILDKGGDFYSALGFERSRGTIPIQLGGNVKHGGLFEVEFGMTLGDIVNTLGQGTRSGKPVKAVQVGGPLGAYFSPEDFHLKFDYEIFAQNNGLVGHAGITVFDEDAHLGQMARFAMEFCAIESCGKCTPCRIGSTRGVETIDKILNGIEPEKNVEILNDLCDLMVTGSLCALGGFAPYPVRSALRIAPQDFGLTAKQAAAE